MSNANCEGKHSRLFFPPVPQLYHDNVPNEFIKCLKNPRRRAAPSWIVHREQKGEERKDGFWFFVFFFMCVSVVLVGGERGKGKWKGK